MDKAMNYVDVSLTSQDLNYTFTSLSEEQRQFPAFGQACAEESQLDGFAELRSFETKPDQPNSRDIFRR